MILFLTNSNIAFVLFQVYKSTLDRHDGQLDPHPRHGDESTAKKRLLEFLLKVGEATK